MIIQEKFKASFGNPKLPKITLEKIITTQKAVDEFTNK